MTMIPEFDTEGLDRYCRWRRHWCVGGNSQAIVLLQHHGLAGALHLTVSRRSEPAIETRPVPGITPVLQEAALMLRDLLAMEQLAQGAHHV